MKLLIDDKRNFLDVDIIARTALAGIAVLKTIYIDELFLDHDLGEVETICLNMVDDIESTGYGVLLWLEMPMNIKRRPKTIILVTDNPAGRLRMELALRSIGYKEKAGQWKL